jgi:hypothetical protein
VRAVTPLVSVRSCRVADVILGPESPTCVPYDALGDRSNGQSNGTRFGPASVLACSLPPVSWEAVGQCDDDGRGIRLPVRRPPLAPRDRVFDPAELGTGKALVDVVVVERPYALQADSRHRGAE